MLLEFFQISTNGHCSRFEILCLRDLYRIFGVSPFFMGITLRNKYPEKPKFLSGIVKRRQQWYVEYDLVYSFGIDFKKNSLSRAFIAVALCIIR